MSGGTKYMMDIRRFYEMSDIESLDRRLRFERNTELLHACLGLSGETGEVIDHVKKHVAYGKPVDYLKLMEELGDCLHYLTRIIDLCGWNPELIMRQNMEKLAKRYGSSYTNSAAIAQADRKGP